MSQVVAVGRGGAKGEVTVKRQLREVPKHSWVDAAGIPAEVRWVVVPTARRGLQNHGVVRISTARAQKIAIVEHVHGQPVGGLACQLTLVMDGDLLHLQPITQRGVGGAGHDIRQLRRGAECQAGQREAKGESQRILHCREDLVRLCERSIQLQFTGRARGCCSLGTVPEGVQ